MATIEENIQQIANDVNSIKTNLGLSSTASLHDVVDQSQGAVKPTGTIDITENGTVDVTNYASANVNVSGGGGSTPVISKGVDFIDYDGTLVASYTPAEAQNLTELPTAPTHNGLVFEDWNWSLADIKTHNDNLVIGALYHTTSGATEFDITLTTMTGLTITLQNLTGMTSIDWGDGTTNTSLSHTYSNQGNYTIKAYGVTALGQFIMSQSGSEVNYSLKNVRLSSSVKTLDRCFRYCWSLQEIAVTNSITSMLTYICGGCYRLKSFVVPQNISFIQSSSFQDCRSMRIFAFSQTVGEIGMNAFNGCYGLREIFLSSAKGGISSNAFNNCPAIRIYDFSKKTSVPTLGSSALGGILNYSTKIVVPDSLYTSWKAASSWSSYRDYIYKKSEVNLA